LVAPPVSKLAKAACIGGGVIGGGWTARFALAGIDVNVFDPEREAERRVGEVYANAERAYARIAGGARPAPGRIRFMSSIAEAVAGADFVQESVPERLELKQRVLGEVDTHAASDVPIGSSTSGLLPSDLQADLTHPGRLLVGHPFNPVYLLPLVEIVGGRSTSAVTIERAREAYAQIGMQPVTVAKEIDAFIGDRLQEALWREALWLVSDGIASVEDVDDVIRYSFGLRWAQMGIFQVYRIAGGEAGMRHFMAQFGPCLKWPWTKLMDVPELDDALIDRIAEQSDAQARGLSIRALERIRDDNLVRIMDALTPEGFEEGWGAGALQRRLRAALAERAEGAAAGEALGLEVHRVTVDSDWIDYNGHMTEHRYVQVFGNATDTLLERIGVDAAYVVAGHSYYTVETHVRHLGEASRGDPLCSARHLRGAAAARKCEGR
jgi:carnitine 3-dehydrogenase